MKQRKCRFLHSWIIHLKQRNFLGIRYYPALFKISTVLIIICTVYPIITFCLTKEGTAGTFGDQYGFINALISGMAFAAFWCSLQLQHRELKLQRKELSRANKEAKAQTQQFEAQTKQFNEQIALARQAQKIDAFYRRLSHLRQQHEDIYYYEEKKTYKGIIAILCLHNEAFKLLKKIKKILEEGINKEIILEDPTVFVSNFWPNVYIWAHSYFGIVQEILSENSEISTNNEFLNILTNSLTPAECDLLYIMNLVIDKPEIKQTLKALETSSTLFRNAQSDITYKDECFSLVCEIIKRNLPPLTLPMSTMYNSSTPED